MHLLPRPARPASDTCWPHRLARHLALLLVAGLGPASAATSAPALAPHDPSPPARYLPNGCVPESYIFFDSLRRAHPHARAKVVVLALPDEAGATYGHALVAFEENGLLFAWDFEFGRLALPPCAWDDDDALRAALATRYLAHLATWSDTLSDHARHQRLAARIAPAEACASAGPKLRDRQAVIIRYRPRPDSPQTSEALAFLGGGAVWVYLPETGSAFAPQTPGQTYAALILAALRTHAPHAELLPEARRPSRTSS